MTREYKIVKIESNERFNTHIILSVYDKKVLLSSAWADSHSKLCPLDKLMKANRVFRRSRNVRLGGRG